MNRILIFIFTSVFLFSCKTDRVIESQDFLQLGVLQNNQNIPADSIYKINIPAIEFSASIDSAHIISAKSSAKQPNKIIKYKHEKEAVQIYEKSINDDEPVKKVSPSKGIRIFIPVIMLAVSIFLLLHFPVMALGIIGIAITIIIFLMLNTNILKHNTDSNRPKSKVWQILFSLLILLIASAFVLLAPTESLFFASIVFVVMALLVFIFAIINNLIRAQPKPKVSKEYKRQTPYNKFALWAGIFFLLFLISLGIPFLVYIPYFYLVILSSFSIALILSIISLINMSKKSKYERGKWLSVTVLCITLLPFIFIVSFIARELLEDILYF